MKIDVEGFEPQVIKGMAKLLDTHKVWCVCMGGEMRVRGWDGRRMGRGGGLVVTRCT